MTDHATERATSDAISADELATVVGAQTSTGRPKDYLLRCGFLSPLAGAGTDCEWKRGAD